LPLNQDKSKLYSLKNNSRFYSDMPSTKSQAKRAHLFYVKWLFSIRIFFTQHRYF